jgi:hypothetical protein
MARLRITIEGEMSPEELKAYISAAWGLKAQLPHDVALSTVDLDAEPHANGTAAVQVAQEPATEAIATPSASPSEAIDETIVKPEPSAPAVVEPEQPAPAPQEETVAEKLGKFKTLAILIDRLEQEGMEWDAILRLCLQHQKHVPLLERQGASLEDRLSRTKELSL